VLVRLFIAEDVCLPVVHITLARVIAKKSIHHDILLTFIEPAIFATEPIFGLARTWGHENPGKEADDESTDCFEEESKHVSFSLGDR
jgi:hypothetical protein